MGAGKVIGKALKESNALLDEFLESIKSAGKTPIVPAPNRWFAKPEEFPHVQPMVERALTASGKTRDDFLHGAYLDPRTGQDLTGRMMDEVGVLIDPRTGRPMMSGRESGLEQFGDLEKRLGNQTLSNLVRRSKFKPTGGDTLLNDIPFIATVEQGPHYYGLGTEYASPTQLFQVQTGSNPHLRPKSRGDVFGMGEVVGRMQIGQGPEHDVYEKLFVAPRGSDVPGKKLSKKKGGEVKMGVGGTVKKGAELVETFLKELNKPAKAAVKAAPQDEALRLAQQRAALPPAQGGLGLPTNNTPMQRAKAMKYVDEGFHETEGSNIEKGLSKFDVKRVGAAASDEQTPHAMFIKPHPAGIGVARKNPAQMPVLVKSNLTDENILMPFQNREELQQYLNQFPEIKQSTQAVRHLDKQIADHINKLTKQADQLDAQGKTEEADKIYKLMESNSPLMKEFDAKSNELAKKSKEQITDLFKSQGVGTVGLTEDRGALGRKTITDMVLNPNENVRSRFAAFDPWRKDAATAAAFGVAAPDLMAKEQEKAMGGDVHMMGGGRPPKKTTLEEDLKSFKDPAMALADMLAGAARGTTATATGFYGDIEDLVRKYGKGLPANVIRSLLPTREGKETLLPTVEEMNAMLPPVVPKGASRSTQVADVYNDLGMANPLAPTAGAAVVKGVKVAAPIIKAGALDLARSEPARRAVNRVAQAAGASPMEIMAYQGSPHLYAATPKNPLGELDPTKIGSGEGAQAYGMGHYLAENRNVGEGYRNSISSQHGQDVTVGGVPVDEYYMNVYGNADQLPIEEAKQQYDKAALIEMLGFNRSPNEILSYAEDMGYAPSVIDWFKTDVMPKTKMPGYLYTHDLSDEAIARMLDWDKPLSQQSQHVKDALSKSDYAFRDMAYDLTGDPDPTGGHISRTGMNPKEFAEHMRSLGVPGVKYLDQESKARQAMDPEFTGGTRNFVLFPGEEDASKIIRREKTGGAVMMGAGGTVKKGIELVDTFLNALKEGEKAVTAADRAAAGRAGAALIKATPQVKASEALGQAMDKGFKKTTTTQSDRTRVGGGNIGGAPFSAISEADPRYAGKVWGVMDQGTASRLANLTSPDTAWSTMLGSATQLKTNPVVFAKLEKQFKKALKEGRLQPELEGKINQNFGLFLGEGANIRDPEIWKMLDTFEKRAAMADIMMGKGVPPSKGGVPLGGEKSGKGVIFNPTETLIEETERGLLHPEHGGYVPTFAVGPRLFSLTGESSFRPDLHPGFPTLLEGKDLGVNMMATPTEVYLPDWHARFKANNPDRQGPGYYDLALGVKGEGLPSQELTDDYIRHLIREGYAEGGEVNADEDGITIDEFLSKQGY